MKHKYTYIYTKGQTCNSTRQACRQGMRDPHKVKEPNFFKKKGVEK
jgi:hypothetical protein